MVGCFDNWVMSKTSFPTTPGVFRGPIQVIWTKREASTLKITARTSKKTLNRIVAQILFMTSLREKTERKVKGRGNIFHGALSTQLF